MVTRRKRTDKSKSDSLHVQQLVRELTCQFCLEIFDDPRMLDCLHVYCKNCIVELEIKNMRSVFKCPECQEKYYIPDVEKLPVHKIANTKKRELTLLKRISQEKMKCSLCPVPHKHAADAIYLCLDCREGQQFLCHNCSSSHYNKPELKDHHLELLDSLVGSTTSNSNRLTLMSRRTSTFSNYCNVHGLQLRYFCETCKLSICTECKEEVHVDHSVESTARVLEDVKQIIPTETLIVIGIRDALQQKIDPIMETRAKIESQKDYLSEEIRTRIVRISKDLEHEEKILQNQLSATTEAKLDMLSCQTREINKMVEKADQLAKMLTDIDKLSFQSDILTVTHTLLDRVDTLKREYNTATAIPKTTKSSKKATLQRQLSFSPCEEANTAITFNVDVIKRELRQKSRIFTMNASPSLCTVNGPALYHPEALKLTYFRVIVRDKYKMPCVSLQDVQVLIKTKSSNQYTPTGEHAEICHSDCNVYTVSFCPRVPGPYTIEVLVNSMPIANSPFCTQVVAPSLVAEKSTLFENIDLLSFPTSITKDSRGNIFITNKTPENRVLALTERAVEVARIEDDQSRLRDLSGVTVDNKGNVYLTSMFHHCILKYNSNGEFVKKTGTIGRGKGNFQNPTGICWTENGDLYVCDGSNCRVSIFDDDLIHKDDISTNFTGRYDFLSNPSCPYDIAFDHNGHVFVSDTVNDCILMFNGKEFMTAFRRVDAKPLQVPKGVTVDIDGYLFVSDSGNHRIAVFRCNGGEPITTLTLPEQNGGRKFSPNGIMADDRGFIYVCDESKKRVVVLSDSTIKLSPL